MNPEIEKAETERSPDLFSRGTLEMTYKLLRTPNPSLALCVRNLLMNQRKQINNTHKNKPRINIALEPTTIGKIVSALTILGQNALDNREVENGKLLVLRSLIEDWAGLAEWLVNRSVNYPSCPNQGMA